MYKGGLQKQTSIEEAERNHLVKNDRLGSDPVPFGFNNHRWKDLKSKLKEGDELWEYSSSKESWMNMYCRSGISIVRDGKVLNRW